MQQMVSASQPAAAREHEQLAAFARQHSGDPQLRLQWWDVEYYSERQKEALFNLNQQELQQYLPLDSVLKGLFDVSGSGVCQRNRSNILQCVPPCMGRSQVAGCSFDPQKYRVAGLQLSGCGCCASNQQQLMRSLHLLKLVATCCFCMCVCSWRRRLMASASSRLCMTATTRPTCGTRTSHYTRWVS